VEGPSAVPIAWRGSAANAKSVAALTVDTRRV